MEEEKFSVGMFAFLKISKKPSGMEAINQLASTNCDITIDQIKDAVLKVSDTTRIQLMSERRTYALQRQIAMFLCSELTGKSFIKIGREFNRDHTTAMYAKRKIKGLLETDQRVIGLVDETLRELRK